MSIMIQFTILYTTVLAIVALGGMFSERSGIINLGLEGIMVIGSLCGAIISSSLFYAGASNFSIILFSILGAILGGWLFSLLLGFACISFKADQTITGTALNIMSTALAVVLARLYTKTTSSQIQYERSIYLFGSDVMISIFTIMFCIIIVLAYIYLYKSKYGLHLMACGEHPSAADSVGINVYKQRYIGVSISGVLAGLGGLAYVICGNNYWDFKNGVSGFGFLALAVMIFGQWKPFRILLAASIFGFCQAISILGLRGLGFSEEVNASIPSFIFKMLPYVISMIVLAISSKNSHAPKAEGIPYDKGSR